MTHRPFCASWESTLRCNLACSHCGLSAGPHAMHARGKELSTDEARGMFQNLSELGVSHLVLSGGEFLTRPDAIELLSTSLTVFSRVRLISNGIMGVSWAHQMKGIEKLTLSLSLDGPEQLHDEIRNHSGSFQRVLNVLKTKTVALKKTIISTITRRNFNYLDALFDIVMSNGVSTWSIQIGLPAGRMTRGDFLSGTQLRFLAEKIYDMQQKAGGEAEIIPDDCFGYGSAMREASLWDGCPAAKDLICVLSNGDVTGCPTLKESFGNIRTDSIKRIWEGEKIDTFRNAIPLCRACNNVVCRGGCRAVDALLGRQLCF